MASGLAALLDDVAAIAKLAAASVDDVSMAAGRAGTKTAGVLIDDAAVTPRYVTGFTPDRELPMIWRITKGSLRNKLLFLLPAAILLSQFAPFLIMPILMMGGCYLSYEGAEKLYEKIAHRGAEEQPPEQVTAQASPMREKTMVASAIRTDLILSAEIMALSLNELSYLDLWWEQAMALALVGIAVTAAVYGAVALIVKMDDIGLHLARESQGIGRTVGLGLVRAMPHLLSLLAVIGTVAMVWVGGGIIIHALESFGLNAPYEWIHHQAVALGGQMGALSGFVKWAVEAFFFGIVGLIVGMALLPVGLWLHERAAH